MLEPLPPEVAGRGAGHNDGAPHGRAVEPLPPLPEGFVLPFVFGPIKKACALAGVSETQFYDKLVVLDPDLMIQNGERSLADLPRLIRTVASWPRGKRAPLRKPRPGNGKGRRQPPPKSVRSLRTRD
jgi:hypothetical protein